MKCSAPEARQAAAILIATVLAGNPVFMEPPHPQKTVIRWNQSSGPASSEVTPPPYSFTTGHFHSTKDNYFQTTSIDKGHILQRSSSYFSSKGSTYSGSSTVSHLCWLCRLASSRCFMRLDSQLERTGSFPSSPPRLLATDADVPFAEGAPLSLNAADTAATGMGEPPDPLSA